MNIQTASTDIVAAVTANPVTVLLDEQKYSEFYERVKAEVSAHVPDLSTEKGRKEIASLAYKVVRSKTAIDAAGKKLNEEARKQINSVDAQRRKIRDELDALAEEVRKPLTEWEDAEKAREITVAETRHRIIGLGDVKIEDGSELIARRIGEVEAITLDPEVYRLIGLVLPRALQRRSEVAELARLRAEAEERERREQETLEAEAKEKAEAERREREEEERKRIADEAAAHARQEEQRKAEERIAAAEAQAQAVKDEADRKERERKEAEERTRREEEARATDRAHRSKVMTAVKEALMAQGAGEATARNIVLAIVAGEIHHVSIKF